MNLSGWWWTVGSLALTAILGIPPLILAWRDRSAHVRSVWTRADPMPEDDGGWRKSNLTVTNGSKWPVWDVFVVYPESAAADFPSVGPSESRSVTVDGEASVFQETLTLQVTDVRGKTWLWTPEASTLSPLPSPITPLARVVQFVFRFLPQSVHDKFHRLPDRVQVFMWGYHPEHGSGRHPTEGHLERARRVLAG